MALLKESFLIIHRSRYFIKKILKTARNKLIYSRDAFVTQPIYSNVIPFWVIMKTIIRCRYFSSSIKFFYQKSSTNQSNFSMLMRLSRKSSFSMLTLSLKYPGVMSLKFMISSVGQGSRQDKKVLMQREVTMKSGLFILETRMFESLWKTYGETKPALLFLNFTIVLATPTSGGIIIFLVPRLQKQFKASEPGSAVTIILRFLGKAIGSQKLMLLYFPVSLSTKKSMPSITSMIFPQSVSQFMMSWFQSLRSQTSSQQAKYFLSFSSWSYTFCPMLRIYLSLMRILQMAQKQLLLLPPEVAKCIRIMSFYFLLNLYLPGLLHVMLHPLYQQSLFADPAFSLNHERHVLFRRRIQPALDLQKVLFQASHKPVFIVVDEDLGGAGHKLTPRSLCITRRCLLMCSLYYYQIRLLISPGVSLRVRHVLFAITSTYTFTLFIFSYITCFRQLSASFCASNKLSSGLYCSFNILWIPSQAAPMPLAWNQIIVPEGSVSQMQGPFQSTPATKRATPKGLAMGFLLELGSPSPKFRQRSETA